MSRQSQPQPHHRPASSRSSSFSHRSSPAGGGGDGWNRALAVALGAVSLGIAGYLAWNSTINTIPKGLVFSGLFGFGLAGLANLFSGDAEFSFGKTLRLTGYLAVFIFLIVLALRAMGLIVPPDDTRHILNLLHTFVVS